MLQRLNTGPRKVLMTLDAVGGVWRYAMDLASSMAPYGIQFTFVGLGPEPAPEQRAEAEALGDLVWLDIPLDWMTEDEAALDALPRALKALASDADVIHLNAPSQAAGLEADVPVITASHSCVVSWFAAVKGTSCPPAWSWQHRRNLAGLLAADAVVVPSRSHGEALRACYGPLDNIHVVYNGSRPQPPTKDEKRPVVAAAGRWWDEGKNVAVIDAMAPQVSWPVVLAGALNGPSGQSMNPSNVQALGPLPAGETQSLLSTAAIVVSPSVYEPFGLVPLEAAKAGAALVLSDIPTYRELWDGAALFAAPHDPSAFADAINELIADPDLATRLGERSRRRAADFTLTAQIDAISGLYSANVHTFLR